MNVGKFLQLHETDNVLVCCQMVKTGEVVRVDGRAVTMTQDIDVGHKIAQREIRSGEKIIKYGVSIGLATTVIQRGEHVHLHNMKSGYIAPHGRKPLNNVSNYK